MAGWAQTLVEGLAELNHLPVKEGSDPKEVNIAKAFFRMSMTVSLQMAISENLGTDKLSGILCAMSDQEPNLLKRLLYECVIVELRPAGYLARIENLLQIVKKNTAATQVLFNKLMLFYFLQKLPRKERAELEKILADLYVLLSPPASNKKQVIDDSKMRYIAGIKTVMHENEKDERN